VKLVIAISIFTLVVPFMLWHIVIAEETIVNLLKGLVSNGQIDVRLEGIKKGLFFSITSEGSHLLYGKENEPILTLEGLRLSINIMSVLTFRPTAELRAHIQGGGNLSGSIGLTGQRPLHVAARDVELSELRGLKRLGLSGKGRLTFELDHVQGISKFKFKIENAKLSPFVWNPVTIPLNLFHTIRGTGAVVGTTIDIRSIDIEGKGINALIKGVLNKNNSDLKLEIMTQSGFGQLPVLEGFLGNFKRSSGYYVVPLGAFAFYN
jgi:type II secretion system protein N